jgi:hypothetical protein
MADERGEANGVATAVPQELTPEQEHAAGIIGHLLDSRRIVLTRLELAQQAQQRIEVDQVRLSLIETQLTQLGWSAPAGEPREQPA